MSRRSSMSGWAKPATRPAPKDLMTSSDNDVKIEVVVNEKSEAFIFHSRPIRRKLVRIEVHKLSRILQFVFEFGESREFGIPIDPRMLRYLETADRILIVLMNEKTGEPIEGSFYPVVIY